MEKVTGRKKMGQGATGREANNLTLVSINSVLTTAIA
jgi:hypothetical protein